MGGSKNPVMKKNGSERRDDVRSDPAGSWRKRGKGQNCGLAGKPQEKPGPINNAKNLTRGDTILKKVTASLKTSGAHGTAKESATKKWEGSEKKTIMGGNDPKIERNGRGKKTKNHP